MLAFRSQLNIVFLYAPGPAAMLGNQNQILSYKIREAIRKRKLARQTLRHAGLEFQPAQHLPLSIANTSPNAGVPSDQYNITGVGGASELMPINEDAEVTDEEIKQALATLVGAFGSASKVLDMIYQILLKQGNESQIDEQGHRVSELEKKTKEKFDAVEASMKDFDRLLDVTGGEISFDPTLSSQMDSQLGLGHSE
ncbi:hypothetical protein BGZ63DRAFT_172388 [Mariannaea sp. PMI_226]|nr:hypothetical protein BGZ63DRAFT_172388 [Mariannaea sp. PMI_226]